MAVYFITGKLGSGKTLAGVGRIREYLWEKRKVATNLDLNIDKLIGPKSSRTVTRLPDKPLRSDFEALGLGADSVEEDRYGAIVLDELGTWFNSRTWNDKNRQDVIDWFLHARKKRWDCYFIVQDISIVDKQLRETLCEHLVICRRMDRFRIPFVGWMLAEVGVKKQFPQVHMGKVFYGDNQSKGHYVETWFYRGRDLYAAYDTEQVFKDTVCVLNGQVDLRRGCFSRVSPISFYVEKERNSGVKYLLCLLCREYIRYSAAVMLQVMAVATGRSPGAIARDWGMFKKNKIGEGRRVERYLSYESLGG